MTENDAYAAVGLLIGGVSMWPEAATDGFVAAFVKHVDNAEALMEVCEQIAFGWKDRAGHPTTGEVLAAYRAHPDVTAEREMRTAEALARTVSTTHCKGSGWVDVIEDGVSRMKPCRRCHPYLADLFEDPERWTRWRNGVQTFELHEAVTAGGRGSEMKTEVPMPGSCKVDTRHDPERIPDFADGNAGARDEYRSVYGRLPEDAVIANPVYAAQVIMNQDRYDVGRDVWRATYVEVLTAFNGDHPRTVASLHALGRRLVWDNQGKLALKPPPEPREALQEPRTPLPAPPDTPEPADSLQDATSLMHQALGDVATRITDD